MAIKKKVTIHPVTYLENQKIIFTYGLDEKGEDYLWISLEMNRQEEYKDGSGKGVCLTKEEAIQVGRMLYNIAYQLGYKNQ